jgi:hypothetical protein
MGEPKKMSAREFRDLGYLQEVNRLFLHPLGLALEVVVEEDGGARFGDVWDERDDPEGLIFDPSLIDGEKAERITAETAERYATRFEALGFWQQPFD